MWCVASVLLATAVSILVRAVFVIASAKSAVDQYYWIMAARVFRTAHRLPVILPDKYLLEDERQAYPPFFGWFLSFLPERLLVRTDIMVLGQLPDLLTLLLLIGYASFQGFSNELLCTIAVVIAVFGSAPILVAYNTQLASRGFGNFFLVSAIVAAAIFDRVVWNGVGPVFFAVSVSAAAATILTHKMSVQLMAVVWPIWVAASGNWWLLLIPLLGLVLATMITGIEFARLQWRAHAQIVTFWNRHHRLLGAHAFSASPIYGEGRQSDLAAFHKPGFQGVLEHGLRIAGYGPLVWLAPVSLLWEAAPPTWIMVWVCGTLAMVLLTLYVPQLRCLGGGHLYMFNAIAPAALWWGTILQTARAETVGLFVLGCVATLVSLATGYRQRMRASVSRDADFHAVIRHLADVTPGRVAVFPVTAADEVAFRSHHAVLWGAHGLDFGRIEPIFPVLRKKIADVMRENGCNLLVFDIRYWPEGMNVLAGELPEADVLEFGRWRLLSVTWPESGVRLTPDSRVTGLSV
jgi:hypothetical protein